MIDITEGEVKRDKILSKHLINGRTYNLMSVVDQGKLDVPCEKCIFNDNADICDGQGGNLCKDEYYTYLTESTLTYSKGHCDVKNDFTIPTTLSEQIKELAKEVKETNQKETELPIKRETTSALATQAGGNHYKIMGIQPVEYIQANNLDYFEGNVVKYVTRHKNKGKEQDIKKAIHYLQLILELQYKEVKE